MNSVTAWSGAAACALQSALRLTNEGFAEHLGVGVRTVAAWHQKPDITPKSEMQQLLDTALEQAPSPVRERFAQLTDRRPPPGAASDAERRLASDQHIGAALDWLDRHANWDPGTSRRQVAARLTTLNVDELRARGRRRGQVDQREIARALADYYRSGTGEHGYYSARYDGHVAETSVLTRSTWLDLACPLLPPGDRLGIASTSPTVELDEHATEVAVQRVAETLAIDTRLVDQPLYRLVEIDVRPGEITGSVGVAPFVEYALTLDQLEGELVDALSAGPIRPGTLRLRDRYLPDLASVLDVSSRLCAGGVLALCAIARPAGLHGGADYLLLVQQRSGHVLNAARRLAPIPKGFHQPLNDIRADARLGATLLRELEEELFGRDDIDGTIADQRSADPMHPSRHSEPMRWLLSRPDRMRMECTGFGLNLVSGNYEFASLVVIEDEEFWSRFGGMVEANWEVTSLQRYSTQDRALLAELISDVAWSNEGLFALLQGLRRLADLGGQRVNLPQIEWEIQP